MNEQKRCGRRRSHWPHTWVPKPKSSIDFDCDGLVDTMTLFDVRSDLAAMCA